MAELEPVASVQLLDAPLSINRPFDYLIPTMYTDSIRRGVFVSVPFGKSNKYKIGVVTKVHSAPSAGLKSIDDICPGNLFLDDETLGLVSYMQEQTLCTFGEAVHAIIPAGTITRIIEHYSLFDSDAGYSGASSDEQVIIDTLSVRKDQTYDTLRSKFGHGIRPILNRMVNKGILNKTIQLKDQTESRVIRIFSLKISHPEAFELSQTGILNSIHIRSEKQLAVLAALYRLDGHGTQEEIAHETGVQPLAFLRELVRKGVVEEEQSPFDDNPYSKISVSSSTEYKLNEEQNAAYQSLCNMADDQQPHGVLLYGITGSGKTSVMVRFIDHLLKNGKGVIVLLPEIALTPQSVGIFMAQFGDKVSVIHSALTPAQRNDAYQRIRTGATPIVIGTRSAVFAPVHNLGAIIIDEEQEHTYKSDNNPKYHARDIARYRCAKNNGVMLLASATPSIESYQKAVEGKYTLLKLTKRYGLAQLPDVEIVDMRHEIQSGNTSPVGTRLANLLLQNQAQDEQSILFINRRGYNNFVSCPTCGEAIRCPNCSVAMTYHTNRGSWKEGRLVCHICGKNLPLPDRCPSCEGAHLVRMGFGTQRVEQELQTLLPSTNILRMDADSTVSRFSVDEILSHFKNREGQILLGTQMVTKGHDFPGVTLVGVLSADASLYLDDYRASERTFAMLTQVIGRAGRGDKPGVALIQTNNPDNDVIRLACAQNYEEFYRREIKLRKLLVFPPFCDITLLTISSLNENLVVRYASELVQTLRQSTATGSTYEDVQLQIFGPFEAPVYKIENKYRMRIIVKCRLNRRTRLLFAELLSNNTRGSDQSPLLSIDFNPNSL